MTATPQLSPVQDTVEVDTTEVACDGGKGPMGHPRVFLHMGPDGSVTCPYCSRTFTLKAEKN